MNRPIKFRAWDAAKNTMLTAVDLSAPISTWDWLGYYDFPLMQFTGLLDKNGKEIYEGDVVGQEDRRGEIVFKLGGFYIKAIEPDWLNGLFLSEINDAVEVIGNVYQNPDLLKTPEGVAEV